MVVPPPEPGLRERKRLATRREIQRAVLTLCSERGIDKVTIDEISRCADISPRTFFNYFASKDSALVGDELELACDEEIDAFVQGSGELLVDLAALVAASVRPAEADREIHELRRAVMKDNTYLFSMRMAFLRDFESRLQDIVQRRLLVEDPALAADEERLSQRALLYALVAVAATRHAWRSWAESDDAGSMSACVAESFRELYTVTSRSD